MINNKKSPRCPYCGAGMFILSSEILGWSEEEDDDEPNLYWYRCLNDDCGCTSPAKRTKEEAYNEAVKRYEAPNRVLTLEEVLKIANENNNRRNHVCWLERNSNYPICPGCIDTLEDGYLTFYEVASEEFDRYTAKEYGIEWRCWLRMTTKEECEAVEWLPEKNEEGDDE